MEIKFNDKSLPSFVKITDINFPILPSVTQNTTKANGRAGMLDFGNEIGIREIEVDFVILGNGEQDYKEKTFQLSDWLYYDEQKKLVLSSDPTRFVWAKFTGGLNANKITTTDSLKTNKPSSYGLGTIKFVCNDPFIYDNYITEEIFAPTSLEPININNKGNIDMYPELDIKFKEDTTQLSIITNDRQLTFGTSANVDETVVDTDPIVLSDDMSSTINWTRSTTVEEGLVTGNFVSNGYSFQVEDFGTGSGWHGASMHRALPKAVQDFSSTVHLGFKSESKDVDKVGKIEVYFKDANNMTMAKMLIYDSASNMNSPVVGARLGSTSGDYNIVHTKGAWNGMLQDWDEGILRIKRVGNKWRFYFAKFDSRRNHYQKRTVDYINIDKMWSNKITRVQISIMAYGERPVTDLMYISGFELWEHNTIEDSGKVPLSFKEGDILNINNGTGLILLNGEPYYKSLDPSSQFIRLPKGNTQIQAFPTEAIDILDSKIRYRNRWL